jgi:hypothetical protein
MWNRLVFAHAKEFQSSWDPMTARVTLIDDIKRKTLPLDLIMNGDSSGPMIEWWYEQENPSSWLDYERWQLRTDNWLMVLRGNPFSWLDWDAEKLGKVDWETFRGWWFLLKWMIFPRLMTLRRMILMNYGGHCFLDWWLYAGWYWWITEDDVSSIDDFTQDDISSTDDFKQNDIYISSTNFAEDDTQDNISTWDLLTNVSPWAKSKRDSLDRSPLIQRGFSPLISRDDSSHNGLNWFTLRRFVSQQAEFF